MAKGRYHTFLSWQRKTHSSSARSTRRDMFVPMYFDSLAKSLEDSIAVSGRIFSKKKLDIIPYHSIGLGETGKKVKGNRIYIFSVKNNIFLFHIGTTE